MTTVWQVNVDRFGDESQAKSGTRFSVIETAEMLVLEYNRQVIEPEIEVVTIGVGAALSDYLTHKKIPHTEIRGLLTRIGSADVIKYRKEKKE